MEAFGDLSHTRRRQTDARSLQLHRRLPARRTQCERSTSRAFRKRLAAQHKGRMDFTKPGELHGVQRGMGVEGKYRRGHFRRKVLSRHRRKPHAHTRAWAMDGTAARSIRATSGVVTSIEVINAGERMLQNSMNLSR